MSNDARPLMDSMMETIRDEKITQLEDTVEALERELKLLKCSFTGGILEIVWFDYETKKNNKGYVQPFEYGESLVFLDSNKRPMPEPVLWSLKKN